MIESAGLLILYDNMMLLCHPTKAPSFGRHDIPKGNINSGEDKIDAAIRETYEEIGLRIDRNDIDPTEHIINYTKKGSIFKKVYYYIVRLENIENLVIPKENFKPNDEGIIEVDWAGFLPYKEAEKRIFWRFKEMLKYIEV
jgi:predicted NUDIX family NTP pyrophosphohydrolase